MEWLPAHACSLCLPAAPFASLGRAVGAPPSALCRRLGSLGPWVPSAWSLVPLGLGCLFGLPSPHAWITIQVAALFPELSELCCARRAVCVCCCHFGVQLSGLRNALIHAPIFSISSASKYQALCWISSKSSKPCGCLSHMFRPSSVANLFPKWRTTVPSCISICPFGVPSLSSYLSTAILLKL